MTAQKRFESRLNVYVSAELQRKLEQIRDQRGPKVMVPDIVREAIRLYIDNEEEIIGSRRHFQRGLRETIDNARDELLWNNLVTLAFLYQLQSPVLTVTAKKQISFKEAFDTALAYATKMSHPMMNAVQQAIEQSLFEMPVKEEKS